MKRMPVVEVEWIDSASTSGWRHQLSENDTYSECRTTGYLVQKTKQCVTVAQSHSIDTGNFADCMHIPRKAVRTITVLRK